MNRDHLTDRQWCALMGERNLRAARIAKLRRPAAQQRGSKRVAVIVAAAIAAALAAWLIALVVLRHYLPCDELQALDALPTYFQCVMERKGR